MNIVLLPLKFELKDVKGIILKLAHLANMVSYVEVGIHVVCHVAFLVRDKVAVFHSTFKEIPWKVGFTIFSEVFHFVHYNMDLTHLKYHKMRDRKIMAGPLP